MSFSLIFQPAIKALDEQDTKIQQQLENDDGKICIFENIREKLPEPKIS